MESDVTTRENGKFASHPAFADDNNISPYRKVPTSLLSRKVYNIYNIYYIVPINDVFNYLRTVLRECFSSVEVTIYIFYFIVIILKPIYNDVPVLCGTFISVNFHSQKNCLYRILFSYKHNYRINVLPITTTWCNATNNFTISTSRTNDMYL